MTTAIRSMTGFGKATASFGAVTFDVEVRSLNHRFLDVTVRLPKGFSTLEMKIRALVASQIKRGKIDISVSRRVAEGEAVLGNTLVLQRPLFEGYLKLYRELLSEFASGMRPESFERFLGEILSKPGIIVDQQNEPLNISEEEVVALLRGIEKGIEELNSVRAIEGASIEKELRGRFAELKGYSVKIEKESPSLVIDVKKRLEDRIRKLFPSIQFEEARLVQEAGILAERVDISEELQRLTQHLVVFENSLSEEAPGKRFDFLLQEMGRECNTIASKSQNAPINHLVVEAKVTLEKIKEQIQNIE